MARPSKLSEKQCARIRMLKEEGISAPQLSKRFKISESSVYKILNGSYVANPSGPAELPVAVGSRDDTGATPSLFNTAQQEPRQQQVAARVIQAADANYRPVDPVTLAAAELIVAQARYAQVRHHDE